MLHRLHRISACIIGTYVVAHIFNHLLALQSVEAHIQFMDAFRHVYRNPFVEPILLFCVTFQIGSGVYFIRRRWGQRHGFFERIQALSGGYLAFFLLVHVGAVLFGRFELELDTNFYYAAAGIHVTPFHYYFLPYYSLAIVAIFCHIACAIHWLTRGMLSKAVRNYLGYTAIIVGIALSAAVMSAFSGMLYDIEIPQAYKATYQ